MSETKAIEDISKHELEESLKLISRVFFNEETDKYIKTRNNIRTMLTHCLLQAAMLNIIEACQIAYGVDVQSFEEE